MVDGSQRPRGLAHGAVGAARVIALGTSIVAPAGSVVTAPFPRSMIRAFLMVRRRGSYQRARYGPRAAAALSG